ncbi:MAG TPA: hypothetical protein PLH86_08815, partial [Saprospiraceae bacterium]|nr:hypothetical protein [Saprospiraceae bacterium]
MLQNTYKNIINYFLPSSKKTALVDEFHLIIEFLVIAIFFVSSFIVASYIISSKEAMIVFGLTVIFFVVTLIAAKNGVKSTYVKHLFISIACCITVLGITYISGGI